MGKNKIAAALAAALELPEEAALALPRLTLLGQERLTVENHQGIVVYGPNRVVCATCLGPLEIAGRDLRLGYLAPEELTITGSIAGLTWMERGENP
ncbi:MAG: YabP/YqfC family sporulation protein [Firmicutes bacterium]|nr:YabP/YqfC family sporulation protein [Bacillota bacterium]